MKNDKELLELAAKSAGIEFKQVWPKSCSGKPGYWNPLDDDGDALRLAVQLDIFIHASKLDGGITQVYGGGECYAEKHGDDPLSATRRAIVRAAVGMAAA